MDDVYFATFKKKLKSKFNKVNQDRNLQGEDLKQELMEIAYESEREFFAKDIILKSFRNCHLFPLDTHKISEKAEKKKS